MGDRMHAPGATTPNPAQPHGCWRASQTEGAANRQAAWRQGHAAAKAATASNPLLQRPRHLWVPGGLSQAPAGSQDQHATTPALPAVSPHRRTATGCPLKGRSYDDKTSTQAAGVSRPAVVWPWLRGGCSKAGRTTLQPLTAKRGGTRQDKSTPCRAGHATCCPHATANPPAQP
jgi:hypothetical protein